MLFELLDRICTDIDTLPPFGFGDPALAQQIMQAAPEAVQKIINSSRQKGNELTVDDATKTLSLLAFTFIRSIPRTARAMALKAQDPRVPAARRAAIAAVLSSVVQPHDIIPDNAPGHYGYLDDAILLNAGLVAYLDTLPDGMDASGTGRLVQFVIDLTPPSARPVLQMTVASMTQLVQVLAVAGREVAEGVLQQIVANPLQASTTVAAPPGFAPRVPRGYAAGHWSDGNYFEGDHVIIGGGGPALIDGQLFIPG